MITLRRDHGILCINAGAAGRKVAYGSIFYWCLHLAGKHLTGDADNEYAMIHRRRLGQPYRFCSDARAGLRSGRADVFLPLIEAHTVIADKGFDADERVILPLTQAGKTVIIPPKRNRKVQREYDKDLYKSRHLIENLFFKLKQLRGKLVLWPALASPRGGTRLTTNWPATSSRLFISLHPPYGLTEDTP